MSQAVDYPLVGSYNNQRKSSIDAERSVNVFEYIDQLAKKPNILINTSGIENTGLDFNPLTLGFRCAFLFSGNVYVVVGNTFCKISDVGGNLVLKKYSPTFATSTGYVGIDANTFQVIIVDSANGYILDTTTDTLVTITDTGFPVTPIDVCNLDGFFVVANGGTKNFQLSSPNQGLVWSGVTGGSNTATTAASTTVTITGGGTSLNYQVGTPITISASTDGNFPNGNYFVVAVLSPTTIQVSATLGGTPITGAGANGFTFTNNGQLQQGAITTHPGNIVACKTLHRRLFLFSAFFTEVWENQGIGTNLPFRRNNTLLMEYGTPSIGSVAVGFDLMFFLSQDRDGLGAVMEVSGTESRPVSNKALDFQLSQYIQLPTTPSGQGVADARGFMVKENGIIFYRLNFTTANHTFVYNVTMSNPANEAERRWHEEEVLNGDRHPAEVHVFFNGLNYYGHYKKSIFYLVDTELFTNDGEPIKRMRIGRPVCPPGYQRTRIDRFQIDLLQGQVDVELQFEELNIDTENEFDLLTEDGNNLITNQELATQNEIDIPSLFFSYSKDGGQTYGTVFELPMGKAGQRTFRTLQRKLGVVPRGQAFVPKIEYFNDLPFFVLGSSWVFEILPE